MNYHILNSVLLSLLQYGETSRKIKIQARCSCQLFIGTHNGKWRAWDAGEMRKLGFTTIPGEIKTSDCDMSKIYRKHLKPNEKVDLPRARDWAALAIFVK